MTIATLGTSKKAIYHGKLLPERFIVYKVTGSRLLLFQRHQHDRLATRIVLFHRSFALQHGYIFNVVGVQSVDIIDALAIDKED